MNDETPDRKTGEDWSVWRDTAEEDRRDFERQLSALQLANRTKDAWLIAQSQSLREPMSSMGSMLGLMDLAHQLALVRPLHQTPSEFDEAAFKHLRRNFERLVGFFNELADLTGEGRLKMDEEERPIVKNSTRPLPANRRV
ncbi:MAG TPA: hypothetical protein VGW57_07065 [Chthoniobacterales bacterium]|nr:hypothetical protein [Chthoniobacterales bacterium]